MDWTMDIIWFCLTIPPSPPCVVDIAGLHRVAGGESTASRSPIILACGSLFVHDGCTFYGFGSPNYQGSTFVIMWDHEVILIEQDLCTSRQGRLNFPFFPTTLGMVAGTRKGIFSFGAFEFQASLVSARLNKVFVSWTESLFLWWLFRFDIFLNVIDLRCFWSYIVDCVMHMPDCKPEDQWGNLLRNADDSTKHCTEQHLCEITGL